MRVIPINTGVPYNIYIDDGILSKAADIIPECTKSKRTVIVTDDIVNRLYAGQVRDNLIENGFSVDVFVVPHGETSKSMGILTALLNFLCEKCITRNDFIIALGGGVVGDLTGYAAACYLRGIDYIQIPTTFLAQIDSSVGGKTAVNIESGKNLIGAFHQPHLVLCDPHTLQTLSDELLSDGVAEAIKYGCIKSTKLFDTLLHKNINAYINDVIYECVDIKRQVVELDEFDRGERMLLNFGHTLGHAIEKFFDYKTFSHGQAVAIGMCTFSKLAEGYGLTEKGVTEKIVAACKKYHLPIEAEISTLEMISNSLNDKKRESNNINLVLIKRIGEGYIHKISVQEYKDFITGDYKCV